MVLLAWLVFASALETPPENSPPIGNRMAAEVCRLWRARDVVGLKWLAHDPRMDNATRTQAATGASALGDQAASRLVAVLFPVKRERLFQLDEFWMGTDCDGGVPDVLRTLTKNAANGDDLVLDKMFQALPETDAGLTLFMCDGLSRTVLPARPTRVIEVALRMKREKTLLMCIEDFGSDMPMRQPVHPLVAEAIAKVRSAQVSAGQDQLKAKVLEKLEVRRAGLLAREPRTR